MEQIKEKPLEKRIVLRLPEELMEQIKNYARERGISINDSIKIILYEFFRAKKEEERKIQ